MENVRVDEKEYVKQLQEEILNTPHSIRCEIIVPPFNPEEHEDDVIQKQTMFTLDAKDGTGPITIALLLKTMEDFILKELDNTAVLRAYTALKLASDSDGWYEVGKGGRDNDTTINT